MTIRIAPTLASRRVLLAGALGGVGTLIASALGRSVPALATDHQAVLQGEDNGGSLSTVVRVSAATAALQGVSDATSGTSYGLRGRNVSTQGAGVLGVAAATTGSSVGVLGDASNNPSGTGVRGVGDSIGVRGHGRTGVQGVDNATAAGIGTQGLSTLGFGVHGLSQNGRGVMGASVDGVGVYGVATAGSGYAIRSSGRIRFEGVSGVATIAAGTKTKTISPGVNLTADSFVLLTPRTKLGGRDLWFTTDATSDTFTIRLSSARSSATKIGWLLLG